MSNPRVTAADLKPKHNKFGVSPKSERDGYASKLEQTAAAHLDILYPTGLMRQVAFPLSVDGREIGRYVADFVVTATFQVYEAKGMMTPLSKWKMRHFSFQYPRYKIQIVKDAGSGRIRIEEFK